MKKSVSFVLSLAVAMSPVMSYANRIQSPQAAAPSDQTEQSQTTRQEEQSMARAMSLINSYFLTPLPANLTPAEQQETIETRAKQLIVDLNVDRTLLGDIASLYTKGNVRQHRKIAKLLTTAVQQMRADKKASKISANDPKLRALAQAFDQSEDRAKRNSNLAYGLTLVALFAGVAGMGMKTADRPVTSFIEGMTYAINFKPAGFGGGYISALLFAVGFGASASVNTIVDEDFEIEE